MLYISSKKCSVLTQDGLVFVSIVLLQHDGNITEYKEWNFKLLFISATKAAIMLIYSVIRRYEYVTLFASLKLHPLT